MPENSISLEFTGLGLLKDSSILYAVRSADVTLNKTEQKQNATNGKLFVAGVSERNGMYTGPWLFYDLV
jgi:hypothetical protein